MTQNNAPKWHSLVTGTAGQIAALKSEARLTVVSAGAGTGKTQTLSQRFAWLLASDPSCGAGEILVLTFTKKAAAEMLGRIKETLSAWYNAYPDELAHLGERIENMDDAYISTIHAFAMKLIRESGLALDIDPAAEIMPAPKEEKPKHLLLPQAAPDNRAMIAYLKGRGIDQEILDYCVQTGRIYESRNKGHSNVVFVGFDKDGKARFGCLRGISEARFHGDLSGSDKHFSFALPACVGNPAVHLCECAIDVMSYATLCKLDGIDWRRHNLLSLAGVYQPKKKIEEKSSSAA